MSPLNLGHLLPMRGYEQPEVRSAGLHRHCKRIPDQACSGRSGENTCAKKDPRGLKIKLLKSGWPGAFLCSPQSCHSQKEMKPDG